MISTGTQLDKIAAAAYQKSSEESYWLKKLSGETRKTMFPYDLKKTRFDNAAAGIDRTRDFYNFEIIGKPFSRVMELINNSDVRLFIVLVTVLAVLLQKYGKDRDIIIGTSIYKQEQDVEFINTVLPLRFRVEDHLSVKELLLQAGDVLKEAVKNQNYPMETLFYQLNIPFSRDDEFPLFDITVLLENIHMKKYLEHINVNMNFSFNRTDTAVRGVLEYNPQLYHPRNIRGMAAHYIHLLETVIFNPGTRVSRLDILAEEEKERILIHFNNTTADYPGEKTIHQLFTEQVERRPDQKALVGKEEGWKGRRVEGKKEEVHLTYKELNEKANQLAFLLIEKGVKPDNIVAIMVERSIEMMVGIFGILKTGGAYLPIDPDYPEERINYMLNDAKVKILVRNSNNFSFPSQGEGKGERVNAPAASLAYVIYTSGSTGKPKGVMIEHRSVINRLNWMQKCYPLGERDVILQKTTFTFDVSVWELFWWSWYGASVHLLKPKDEVSPDAIVNTVERYGITTLHFVPSMLNFFLGYLEVEGDMAVKKLSWLRQVFSSGEALLANHVQRFYQLLEKAGAAVKLINLYGPTEATVDVSYYNCLPVEVSENIPIGKPIDNIRLYIFDNSLCLQPTAAAGELYISGAGLARGYLNRPGLTAERFCLRRPGALFEKTAPGPRKNFLLSSPYSTIYRTGDLARWLPDGNIEFLGRMDHQVKVRGYRVELGEIESWLLKHPQVKKAVVIAKETGSEESHLVAYVVPAGEFSSPDREETLPGSFDLNVSGLRKYLSLHLPDYMIPSYIIKLSLLPVTPNGKVDRKALPGPSGLIETGVDYVAPDSEVEKIIADIWKEVLNQDKVSIMDSFFDLGGTSIKIIQVNNKLKETFQRDIPVINMFRYTTISALAEYLNKTDTGAEEMPGAVSPGREAAETKGKNRMKHLKKIRNESRI